MRRLRPFLAQCALCSTVTLGIKQYEEEPDGLQNKYMHVGVGPIITRGLDHTANQDAVAKPSVLISMLCPVLKTK